MTKKAILIYLLMVLVLALMGRQFFCKCNEIHFWVTSVNSNQTSQQFTDPYSFSHFQHGLLFFFLFYWLKVKTDTAFIATLLVEAGWEILENTSFIINRYREATISLDYFGDSIFNSSGDILCCALGFLFAARFPGYITFLIYIMVEAAMLYTIKDSLLINMVMLVYPLDSIKSWQMLTPAAF